ncbi:protein of unknown function [Streptomyces murinus]
MDARDPRTGGGGLRQRQRGGTPPGARLRGRPSGQHRPADQGVRTRHHAFHVRGAYRADAGQPAPPDGRGDPGREHVRACRARPGAAAQEGDERDGRGGALRPLRHGSGVAGPPAPAGGRPHRRQLAGQPHREPPVPLPQLPFGHRQLPGPGQGAPHAARRPVSGGVRYTRERLAEAAEQCASLDEVIAFLGTRPYAEAHRHLTKRFAPVSTSRTSSTAPPGSGARAAPLPWNCVPRWPIRSPSRGRCAAFSTPAPAHGRAVLRRWIAEEGISTAHFLGQSHQHRTTRSDRLKSPEEILAMADGIGHVPAYCAARCARWVYRSGVPSAVPVPSGSESRWRWRSTTSTETGATTGGRTCGCCVPIAIRPRAPGAEAVCEGILTPGKVRPRLAPVLQRKRDRS